MISSKYKDLYLSTTKEQLKKLSDFLLYLEKKPSNQNLLENIFRLIHSMKGAAATMGFKKTVNLLHAMESVIDAAYNNELVINGRIMNILFDTLNVLKDNFQEISKNSKELVLSKQTNILKDTVSKKIKNADKKIVREKHILGTLPTVAEVDVSTDKLDELSRTLDDLLINSMKIKNRAKQSGDVDFLKICVDNDRVLSELRRQLKKIRVVPLKDVLSSLPYLVREISRNVNKKVDLVIRDHDLSLDKAILDELMEILIQLIKNAVSHGISSNQKNGKISIDISLVGDKIRIVVSDNGQGIDWQKIKEMAVKNKFVAANKIKTIKKEELRDLIFYAGLTKSTKANTVSGRGIGLSLVKNKIQELHGSISVESEAKKGTEFTIDLPQPLSVFRSIIFNVLDYTFAIPLDNIDKLIDLEEVNSFDKAKYFSYKKKKYKLISIIKTLDIKSFKPLYKYVALINKQDTKVAMPILRKAEEDELIMKKTPLVLKDYNYIKGVAVSAKGQVILVLDINNLI